MCMCVRERKEGKTPFENILHQEYSSSVTKRKFQTLELERLECASERSCKKNGTKVYVRVFIGYNKGFTARAILWVGLGVRDRVGVDQLLYSPPRLFSTYAITLSLTRRCSTFYMIREFE